MTTTATPPRLAAFPPERPDRPQTPAPLVGRGFFLRAAGDADLPWLRALYAETRADEMAAVPWSDNAKRGFLDRQFDLQHQHYLQHFADADFMTLWLRAEDGGVKDQPIGRYYLLRDASAADTGDHDAPADPLRYDLIVDISVFSRFRGQGIGRALIEASQRAAASAGRGMRLHVLKDNRDARRLYERLGFAITHSIPTHHHMRWLPESLLTRP